MAELQPTRLTDFQLVGQCHGSFKRYVQQQVEVLVPNEHTHVCHIRFATTLAALNSLQALIACYPAESSYAPSRSYQGHLPYSLATRINSTSGKVMRDRISSFLSTGSSPRYFFTTAEAS